MKKIVKVGAAILSLSLALGIGCTVYNVYAKTSWTDTKIKEEYDLWEEFKVPEREVTVNGETVKAKTVVTTPDGNATKEKSIQLETAGKYTVTYTAKVDKKHYVDEESFIVHNNLYGFSTDVSSATWGKYDKSQNAEGLMVRLAEGDKLTLNEPINLSELQDGAFLIQAFATPDIPGHADFQKLCFQLTDVNDPEATLYFSARQANWDDTLPYSYVVAGGNGQTPKGKEQNNQQIHEEGYFGYITMHSFGLGSELCAPYCDEQMLQLRIDLNTMEAYAKEGMIADLDSAEYFDTVWEGFPSGQAYLSVWADVYTAKTANFCLVKAGNIDLTQGKVEDTEPPVITINKEYEEVPSAVKGGRYHYIPTATARDLTSGDCEVTTSVYYNYQQPDSSVLDVKDGSFATERLGHYAIVYEATDQFGNLGREMIWVKAEKELPKPSIELKEKPESTWTVGKKFVPAEYTYECHVGNPSFHVYATNGKKTYDLNDGYRFEKEGTYKITYEVKDCAGQTGVYEYDLKVKIGDCPELGEDIDVPAYMMEGTEYTFPKVAFYDYRGGKKEKKIATGKIVDAAGETKVKAGETYEVEVEKNGDEVTIIYECEKGSYEVKVPVVKSWMKDNGKSVIAVENYFLGRGFTCEKGEGYNFKATAADGGWMFANKLLAENFTMQLQGLAGSTEYESIVLEMRDSVNADEVLTVELPYEAGTFAVKVGEHTQTLKKGVDLGNAGLIDVEYKAGGLYVAGAKIKKVDFDGFSSNNLYLSVKFKGAGSNAALKLFALNNHTMGTSKADKIEPKIVLKGNYGGAYEYGKEITLPIAVAADVLNPNITFTMKVTCGKEVVKDVNGKKLEDVDPTKEYTIKASEYGKYNVVYTAYESFSEKDASLSYMIHVTDDVAPEMKFSGKPAKTAKAGDTISIPSYSVSDNVTEEKDIVVNKYVEDANGVLIPLLGDSNAIKAEKAGKYKFIVMAFDKEGNVCNESWTVTVKED